MAIVEADEQFKSTFRDFTFLLDKNVFSSLCSATVAHSTV
jgi:hypothetical protein